MSWAGLEYFVYPVVLYTTTLLALVLLTRIFFYHASAQQHWGRLSQKKQVLTTSPALFQTLEYLSNPQTSYTFPPLLNSGAIHKSSRTSASSVSSTTPPICQHVQQWVLHTRKRSLLSLHKLRHNHLRQETFLSIHLTARFRKLAVLQLLFERHS